MEQAAGAAQAGQIAVGDPLAWARSAAQRCNAALEILEIFPCPGIAEERVGRGVPGIAAKKAFPGGVPAHEFRPGGIEGLDLVMKRRVHESPQGRREAAKNY